MVRPSHPKQTLQNLKSIDTTAKELGEVSGDAVESQPDSSAEAVPSRGKGKGRERGKGKGRKNEASVEESLV